MRQWMTLVLALLLVLFSVSVLPRPVIKTNPTIDRGRRNLDGDLADDFAVDSIETGNGGGKITRIGGEGGSHMDILDHDMKIMDEILEQSDDIRTGAVSAPDMNIHKTVVIQSNLQGPVKGKTVDVINNDLDAIDDILENSRHIGTGRGNTVSKQSGHDVDVDVPQQNNHVDNTLNSLHAIVGESGGLKIQNSMVALSHAKDTGSFSKSLGHVDNTALEMEPLHEEPPAPVENTPNVEKSPQIEENGKTFRKNEKPIQLENIGTQGLSPLDDPMEFPEGMQSMPEEETSDPGLNHQTLGDNYDVRFHEGNKDTLPSSDTGKTDKGSNPIEHDTKVKIPGYNTDLYNKKHDEMDSLEKDQVFFKISKISDQKAKERLGDFVASDTIDTQKTSPAGLEAYHATSTDDESLNRFAHWQVTALTLSVLLLIKVFIGLALYSRCQDIQARNKRRRIVKPAEVDGLQSGEDGGFMEVAGKIISWYGLAPGKPIEIKSAPKKGGLGKIKNLFTFNKNSGIPPPPKTKSNGNKGDQPEKPKPVLEPKSGQQTVKNKPPPPPPINASKTKPQPPRPTTSKPKPPPPPPTASKPRPPPLPPKPKPPPAPPQRPKAKPPPPPPRNKQQRNNSSSSFSMVRVSKYRDVQESDDSEEPFAKQKFRVKKKQPRLS